MPPGQKSLTPLKSARFGSGSTRERHGNRPASNSSRRHGGLSEKPVPPAVPAVKNQPIRNPIDAFMLAKPSKRDTPGARRIAELWSAGILRPSRVAAHARAGRAVRQRSGRRRVGEAGRRLLASPRYGERWGRYWLDLVRYADTAGFETDITSPRLAISRLGDQVVQRRQALRHVRPGADRRRRVVARQSGSGRHALAPERESREFNRRIGTGLFTLGSFPIESTYYGDQFRAEWRATRSIRSGAAFLGSPSAARDATITSSIRSASAIITA